MWTEVDKTDAINMVLGAEFDWNIIDDEKFTFFENRQPCDYGKWYGFTETYWRWDVNLLKVLDTNEIHELYLLLKANPK